VTTEEVGSYN